MLVVVPTAASSPSYRRAEQLRVLGARRSASYDGGFGNEGQANEGQTRPLRVRRRFRIAFRIAKILLAIVVVLAAAVGLLYVLTPSAGQATSLAEAQAQEHHIAYPGPPVPPYFAQALVATEDHRFNSDPGVDPLAMARVVVSWISGHKDQGGSTIDQQLAKNLYTGGHSGFALVYPKQARARLVHVIGRMAAVGYLTTEQELTALNAPLDLSEVRGCQ